MPTPSGAQTAQTALQAQITDLGVRMEKGFAKLEDIMTGVESRVRGLEQREAGCSPMVNARLDAAWKAIDELKTANVLQSETNTDLREGTESLRRLVTGIETKVAIIFGALGLIGGGAATWMIGKLLGLIA